MLTLLQHLSADPGDCLSDVAAGRDDARVACITLHAMRTAARAAACLRQPVHRPHTTQPTIVQLDMPVCRIALGRCSCCGARAQADEM